MLGAGQIPNLLWAIAVISMLATSSCEMHDQSDSVIQFSVTDTLAFDVGFPVLLNQSGTWEDHGTGETTFYFANTLTSRSLKRFNLNGVLVQEVSLAAGIDTLGEASGVLLLDTDTILIFSPYGGTYVIVNGQGSIISVKNIQVQLVDSLGYEYELMTSVNGNILVRGGIVFQAYCRGNQYDSISTKTDYSEAFTFYDNVGRSAHIAILRDYTTTPTLSFILEDYYYNTCKQTERHPRLWVEPPLYSCVDDEVWVYSVYTPVVHRINVRTEIIDSLIVSSEQGPVHCQIPPLYEAQLQNGQELINKRFKELPHIKIVIPIPKIDRVLVVVSNPNKNDENGSVGYGWSYILLNSKGNRIGEARVSELDHIGNNLILAGDHIWVQRATTPKDMRAGLLRFDELKILK